MQPILTSHLFLPLQTELVALLRNLAPQDWSKPTVAGDWTVKDIAAHLLDTDLRRLSAHRDGYRPASTGSPPRDYDDILKLINNLNATWVDTARRLSPRVMTDLLEWTGPQVAAFFASLEPEGEAAIGVAWAGETRSRNWMDIGREYTEKWHHQAQIRDAVAAPLLLGQKWLGPVLAISMLALPHAFRQSVAPSGSTLNVTIDGEAGGKWILIREDAGWRLETGETRNAQAQVRMDTDTAWRLFFNALKREEAEKRIEAVGNQELCSTFLNTRAVMV